jgi:Transposase DDE domain
MFCDATRAAHWRQLTGLPFRLFAPILTPELIARAARMAECPLGESALNVATLTHLAISCAYHQSRPFAQVLSLTLKLLDDLNAGPGQPRQPPPPRTAEDKHNPKVLDPDQLSNSAFTQARARLPWGFWLALIALLADNFEHAHPTLVRWRGRYRLLCLDGTTIDLPNEKAVLDYFGSAGKGKKGRRQAQARMVMLQLTNARVPWRFDLTPLAEAEVQVAQRLLAEVHRDDVVLMDRAFFTYETFWRIANRDAFFVTRLRKQIKFKVLRELAPGDQRIEWTPQSREAKKAIKEQELPTSIELRVINYQVKGFRPSAVVTNLLDAQEVTAHDLVGLAATEEGRRVQAGLYQRRWQVEISFLEMKITQGMEGELRSRVPSGIRYEVGGHVLLYTLMRWLLADAAQEAGLDDPLRLSFQDARREYEDLRSHLFAAGPRKIKKVWRPRLLARMASHEVPWRPNRHYKRPNDTKAKHKGGGRYQPASKLETDPPEAAPAGPTPEKPITKRE